MDPEPDPIPECGKEHVGEEHLIVRRAAARVEREAQRARAVGLVLTAVGMVALLAAAGFSGYTALKAREQSIFNGELTRSIAEYSAQLGATTDEAHRALENNIRCVGEFFARRGGGPAPPQVEELRSCFGPILPHPPPLPEKIKKGQP